MKLKGFEQQKQLRLCEFESELVLKLPLVVTLHVLEVTAIVMTAVALTVCEIKSDTLLLFKLLKTG